MPVVAATVGAGVAAAGFSFGKMIVMSLVTSAFTTIGTAIAQPIVNILQAKGLLDPDTYSVMQQYTEDLTSYARAGKLHDAIGRDKEIDSLINILTRDGKGNPCVMGEPGVGKTALVEGLAYRIAAGNVPEEFKNKKIIRVKMVDLIAGKAYNNGIGATGRMRALFDKAKEDKNIILFIDEFHQVVQCGAAELCKTYLEHGDIKVIAATTTSEYSYITKDPALERRFTKVSLDEPSEYQTVEILKGLTKTLEARNRGTRVSDEALLAAVELSGRYMKNRTYPDKAIDVLNSAVRIVDLKNSASAKRVANPVVSEEDIRRVISLETGIPITDLTAVETQTLEGMDERIKNRIVGQDKAIKVLCDAVRRGRIGLGDPNRPRASFLLGGTSGVGKTALAKALGDEVGNLIELDMAQYGSSNSLNELIGSKVNGYKGELLEKVWKRPYSVVLFDGIDKCSEPVLNTILDMLEKGYITNSAGNKVDFRNTIVIMTTSIGSKTILACDEKEDASAVKNKAIQAIANAFGSDIVNKVDKTLIFNKLSKTDLGKISKIFIEQIQERLNRQNVDIRVDKSVEDYLLDIKIDPTSGARQIRKRIQDKLEKPITDLVIKGKVKKGNTVVCGMENGKIKLTVE